MHTINIDDLLFKYGQAAAGLKIGENFYDLAEFKAVKAEVHKVVKSALTNSPPSKKLRKTLTKIEEAGRVYNLDGAVLDCIAASWNGADAERGGFAQEMAMQYGFTIIDDDAEIYGVTAERLADMMSVLGFRTRAEREAASQRAEDPVDGWLKELISGIFSVPATGTYAIGGVIGSNESQFMVKVSKGYAGLHRVLVEALDQAQGGKGAERHNLGGDVPFERQRMQTVSELIGSVDGMTYQACKKITEGVKLPTLERQERELLGAINYIAGMIIFLRKQAAEKGAADPFDDAPKPSEITVKVNVDATDATQAIDTLRKSTEQTQRCSDPRFQKVTDAALRVKNDLGTDAAKRLLKWFGAARLHDLPELRWAEFISLCDLVVPPDTIKPLSIYTTRAFRPAYVKPKPADPTRPHAGIPGME